MKDSGIPWIGEIPSHWRLFQTSTLFHEHKEKNNGLKEKNLLSLSYGQIKRKDINSSEGLLPQSFETYNIIEKGDIVFRLTDLQNDKRSLRTGLCKERGIITSAYVSVRANTEIDSRYFHYLYHSYDICKVFYGLGDGVRQGMNYDDLKKLLVFLPPFAEQQAIADFLDKKCSEIDEMVSLQEKIVEELKEYKQSVITEAVCRGLNPDVPMRDSGIEWIWQIPESWEVKRMKNICVPNPNSLTEKEDADFEFDYVDIGSVSFEKGIFKTEHYLFKDAPSRARRRAQFGDMVMSTVRTYLRAIDTIDTEEKAGYIYSTGFAVLTPYADCDYRFLSFVSKSQPFLEQVAILSRGINYPSINTNDLLTIFVAVPSIEEQQAIANYLDEKCAEIDALISVKQSKIDALKEYKKSIIYEYITGKKEVI